MGFFERLKRSIRKIRTKLIVYLVIVLVVAVIGLAPFTVSFQEGIMASEAGEDFWQIFFTQIAHNLTKPLSSVSQCFTIYLKSFLNAFKWYFILCSFFAFIGLLKSLPKHEFEDIENGSSDWSENGEQYAVLNRNKGIILAEKNRLPVDKRGNVNVLVVRRFWCG